MKALFIFLFLLSSECKAQKLVYNTDLKRGNANQWIYITSSPKVTSLNTEPIDSMYIKFPIVEYKQIVMDEIVVMRYFRADISGNRKYIEFFDKNEVTDDSVLPFPERAESIMPLKQKKP